MNKEFEAKCMQAHRDGDSMPLQDRIDELHGRRVLTCVYCGEEFAEGTPASQHEALYRHIAVCLRHPLAKAVLLLKNLRPFLQFAPPGRMRRADELRDLITAFLVKLGVESSISDDERLGQ